MTDIPKLTDAEAAVLRLPSVYVVDILNLAHRGLLSLDSTVGESTTDLGRQALAAYDAQKRAEILKPALDLLGTVEDVISYCEDISDSTIYAIRALLDKEGR